MIVPVRAVVSALGAAENFTVPLPVPLAAEVRVSQSGLPLTTVHGQLLFPVVMLKLPVPPVFGTFAELGESVYVQVDADWVTVKVVPATVSVPVRSTKKGLDATVYPTEPSPVPGLPNEIVIQMALLIAVREHVWELAEIAI